MLVYSPGLRVGEVVKLKPEDIDSKKMLVFLKGAKSRKGGVSDIVAYATKTGEKATLSLVNELPHILKRQR